MTRRRSVVIGGALAARPGYGGHTWMFLQYLLGFRDLGWDVLLLDRIDPGGEPAERSEGWRYLCSEMRRAGLRGCFALGAGEGNWLGMPRSEVVRRVRESDLFLNVMGYIEDPEILAAARCKLFLDIDPGFGQMWKELGLADLFGGHDLYLTVGANLGKRECTIPAAGIDWHPVLPPVVLGRWPATPAAADGFATIGCWRGPFEPVEYRGRRYGLRAHEFRRLAALPKLAGCRFRLAMEMDEADRADRELLAAAGWELEDPRRAAPDPSAYRRWIQRSWAEFGVAKQMYVASRSGWVSDRTACFLASGKPVLAQDTGLEGALPAGEGLVLYDDLEGAVEGAARISRDYPAHCRAARRLAEECLDSRKVLKGIAALVGV